METIKTIMKWHEETFPRAEGKSQAKRVYLEFVEYKEAKTLSEQIDELADTFIAWCGLLRFNFEADLPPIFDEVFKQGFSMLDFLKSVSKKMNVNRQRSSNNYWVWVEDKQQYIAAHKLLNN